MNSTSEYNFIVNTLVQKLGTRVKIYLFGSRAQGSFHKFSDVDIAIDNGALIGEKTLLEIKLILSESDYPYKVDLLDLNNKPDYFDIGQNVKLYP